METTLEDTKAVRGRRGWRVARRIVQLTIAVLGIFLAWRMVESLSPEDLLRRIREARHDLVGGATLLLVLRWYLWQARWQLSLIRSGHRTTLLRRASALMASVFINHVALRFFGGVLRGRYLAGGRAAAFPRQYGIVLFDQLMHQLATTVFTWLAIAYVFFRLGWNPLGVVALATLAILLAVVPAAVGPDGGLRRLASRLGDRARDSGRFTRLADQGREIPIVFARLLRSLPHVTRAAVLTWLYIGANVVAQWLLFRAIGAEIPLLTVAAVVGIGSVIGTLSGLPGGLGPMEAALISGYALLGIDRFDAVAGTLLYRGLHYILVLTLGLPSLLYVELGLERSRAPEHEVNSRAQIEP